MRIHSLLLLTFASAVFCADSGKLSEALGHMIGKNLQSLNIPLDIEAIAKGLQDEAAGIDSPMTDDACVQTLIDLQEETHLNEASQFLKANQKREGIVVVNEGKLQFEILKVGHGQLVQSYNSPWVRLKKQEVGDTVETKDEIIALDEAIPGLKLGIVGMREGEIRKLYIHPDLAFRKERCGQEQTSLLILEVEILKADASSDAHAASNTDSLPILSGLDDERPHPR